VQLGGVHPELGDHREHQLGEQAGPVGVEQLLGRPTDPIVVDDLDLAPRQTEQPGGERGGPLPESVERCAAQQQIGDHQAHRGRRGQTHPDIGGGQIALQQRRQPGAAPEVVDQRQPTQPLARQLERTSVNGVHAPLP